MANFQKALAEVTVNLDCINLGLNSDYVEFYQIFKNDKLMYDKLMMEVSQAYNQDLMVARLYIDHLDPKDLFAAYCLLVTKENQRES